MTYGADLRVRPVADRHVPRLELPSPIQNEADGEPGGHGGPPLRYGRWPQAQ